MSARISASIAVAWLLSSGAAAQECTPAIESRWTAATREDERGAQIIEREAKKGSKANRTAVCRVAQSVPNLLRAAKAYYEACDPEEAAAALATIQAHADQAAAFVEANCRDLPPPAPAKPAPAPRPANRAVAPAIAEPAPQ